MRLLAICLLVTACADTDADERDPPADAALIGTFHASVSALAGLVSVYGDVFDGPTPAPLVWDELDSAGDCALLVPRAPYCEEECAADSICGADHRCVAYPSAIAVGPVTVQNIETAAGASTFTMDPIDNRYRAPEPLAYPAFAAGEPIIFYAAGTAELEDFTLQAGGVDVLDLTNDTIVLDGAVDLSWTAAQAGTSEIHIELDISHHGGTRGKIECVIDDLGSHALPAQLLDRLINLGFAGFPTIAVTRRSIGSATTALGRIDLVVSSPVVEAVDIPGLDSCNADPDCPTDKPTCLLSDRMCVP